MAVPHDVNFKISPQCSGEEGECIEVQISGEQSVVLFLTPQQAREMASDLIQTVYRAEVKNSLMAGQRRSNAKAPSSEKFSLHTPHAA